MRKLLVGAVVSLIGALLFALAAFRAPSVILHQPITDTRIDRLPLDRGSFALRFVELNDDGYFADRQQIDALFRDLKSEMETTEATVLLYVHGWNHNAATDNANLACFKQLARAAALMQSELPPREGRPRTVFAVYVGWPGLVYESTIINKVITFYGREATADRIGERGDLLVLFSDIARLRDEYRALDRDAKFVIVSHSLGARMTYKALRPIMQSAAQATDQRGQLADVAVLVNPALSADDHASLDRLMKSATPSDRPPRFIVATSTADEVLAGPFMLARRAAAFIRSDFRLSEPPRFLRRLPVVSHAAFASAS